jgi:hypothetical protein
MPVAGDFGNWLFLFCDREQYRRAVGHKPARDTLLQSVVDLSNRELAAALRAITILSYTVKDESVGDFIDRIVFVITLEAASRLEKNG